jgi:hypothetical protein
MTESRPHREVGVIAGPTNVSENFRVKELEQHKRVNEALSEQAPVYNVLWRTK